MKIGDLEITWDGEDAIVNGQRVVRAEFPSHSAFMVGLYAAAYGKSTAGGIQVVLEKTTQPKRKQSTKVSGQKANKKK